MIEHRADNYECVQRYPILKGYLEHFKQVSMNNEIPGLISFFFILGQAAVPYVRIPVKGSNLDPRVNMFWIQDTRTGKSAAYQIIEKILKDSGMESTDYNSGNDAALVGTLVPDPEGENDHDVMVRPGILAGRKGLNFDEGSVILKSGQHNENTTLFLQSALNSAGTGRNILVKHMARQTFEVKSEVSLWITTYPPKGIKEHVLDKGIFQRVLTYWRHWTLEMKKEVNMLLAEGVYEDKKFEVPLTKVIDFFTKKQETLKSRVIELASISKLEWDEMKEEDKKNKWSEDMEEEEKLKKWNDLKCKSYTAQDDQEAVVMRVMRDMFTIDDSYIPALISAIEEYYGIVEVMGPEKQGICSSFIMGLQNYTNILAHHMAMIEGTWTVRGDHVDMAKEILFDLYQNLIQWLESEVKVGSGGNEKKKMESFWKQAFNQSELFDFNDTRGQGWAKKKDVMDAFGKIANLNSHASVNTKYNMYGPKLFKDTREGVRVYLKLREEHIPKKGAKK